MQTHPLEFKFWCLYPILYWLKSTVYSQMSKLSIRTPKSSFLSQRFLVHQIWHDLEMSWQTERELKQNLAIWWNKQVHSQTHQWSDDVGMWLVKIIISLKWSFLCRVASRQRTAHDPARWRHHHKDWSGLEETEHVGSLSGTILIVCKIIIIQAGVSQINTGRGWT